MRDLEAFPAGGRTAYAEQRDRAYAATLDAIDDVTGTCMGCGQPIPEGSLSDIFCAYKQNTRLVTCQYRALRDGTDSTARDAEESITPDRAGVPTFIPGVRTFYRSFDLLDGGIVPPPVQAPLTPRQVAVHGTYGEWEGSGPMPTAVPLNPATIGDSAPIEDIAGASFEVQGTFTPEGAAILTGERLGWFKRLWARDTFQLFLQLWVTVGLGSGLMSLGLGRAIDSSAPLWGWLVVATPLLAGVVAVLHWFDTAHRQKWLVRRWFRRHILRKQTTSSPSTLDTGRLDETYPWVPPPIGTGPRSREWEQRRIPGHSLANKRADTDDSGAVTVTYVCQCGEQFRWTGRLSDAVRGACDSFAAHIYTHDMTQQVYCDDDADDLRWLARRAGGDLLRNPLSEGRLHVLVGCAEGAVPTGVCWVQPHSMIAMTPEGRRLVEANREEQEET